MAVSFNICWVLETNIFLDVVPSNLRSTANSIMICLLHSIGDSISPYWVGLTADECLKNEDKDTINSLIYCSQISNYPLVFLYFIAGSLALFMTFTFNRDKKLAREID